MATRRLGYREEDRVNPQSMTEAYVAVRLHHRHLALERRAVLHAHGQAAAEEVHGDFRPFQDARRMCSSTAAPADDPGGNVLVIRIQPDEGISLRIASKIPGPAVRTERVKMDFQYTANPGAIAPETKSASAAAGNRYATPAAPAADDSSKADESVVLASADDDDNDQSDKAADAPVVAEIESAANEESTAKDVPEPTIVPEVVAQTLNETSTATVTANDAELAPTPASAEAPIARGQEPKDDLARRGSDPATDIGGAIDAITSDRPPLPEPRTSTPPSEPSSLSDASRAKQAFNNPPAMPSDRYSAAGATAAAPQATTNSGPAPNPFVSQNAAPPATQAAPRNDIIQPLPPSPAEVGDRLSNLDQGGNGLRPLKSDNSAELNAERNASAGARIGSVPPRNSMANPYDRQMPIANEPSRNNIGDASLPGTDGTGKPGEKCLEGPQQPTLVIQKFAPGEIQVGKPAKFVVQVRNAGAQSADDVTIRDEIPQGTKLVSTSPNATTEGSHIVWQLGKLSPGEDRTVEMQLMPTAEGEIGSVATVSYSAQASVKTHCTMPQLAIRMTAANEVMIGSQQHVKIEIRNPGTGDATGVMLFENVPPNVKHAAGPALEFEIGTLRPGETRELDLVLTAEKAGKVVNALTARADGNLQVQQQVEFEVIAPALTVALDGPERRYLERPATYEVSVENPGTAAAHDVQIVTKLPKGMRFVRANNMGEYDAATHAVYWSLAELPKGERGTVELVAMPIETGPQTLQVEGHAQQGLADHKQREIVVEGLAAIMFEVRDLEDPIEVGGETGYEIRVVNQGTKAADECAGLGRPSARLEGYFGRRRVGTQDSRRPPGVRAAPTTRPQGRHGLPHPCPRPATGRSAGHRPSQHRRPGATHPPRRKHARVRGSIDS